MRSSSLKGGAEVDFDCVNMETKRRKISQCSGQYLPGMQKKTYSAYQNRNVDDES
jgi:hypothetical protein